MDMIDMMINDIANFSFDTDFINTLATPATSYDAVIGAFINDLIKNVTFGIGASLLGIFMLMEIISIIQRSDGGSGYTGLKIPANIFIKWGIITFLFCNLSPVLNGIQSITAYLAAQLGSTDINFTMGDASAISASIKGLNFMDRIFATVVIELEWLIFNLFKSLISVLLVFRIFEIWIMTMFSPIPLATLPSQEFRQTAINFIKSYAAVCLTGAVIVAAFVIYGKVMPNHFQAATATTTGFEFSKMMLKNMLYLAALVMIVVNAGKISKSIINAI